MRGNANLSSFKSLLAVAGGLAVILSAHGAVAEDAGKAGGPLEAILHPVNRATGDVNESTSLGAARFTASGGKTQVSIQANGISVAGSEPGVSADGAGDVYPRSVQIFSGTCAAAVKSGTSGAERLPDLPVTASGAATLIATSATALDKLAGQTVVIMKPNKPGDPSGVPVACGTIKAK